VTHLDPPRDVMILMKTDAVLNELPLTSRNLVILFSVRVRPHDVITFQKRLKIGYVT
jgi:hypothetical protein